MDKINQNSKMEYDGFMLRPVFPQDKIDWHKAQTLGPTEEELLTALYYDYSKWLEEVKTVCERSGKSLEQYLRKAFGLAIEAGRVRDCNNNRALRLLGPERSGPDILLFFVKECPHARDALLRGELPPYPWRISQSIEQEQKPAETKQDIIPIEKEKEKFKIIGWLLKKTSRLVGAIIVAIIGGLIVAILIDIFGDFGWLEGIKTFIYKILHVA